jgi:hypothetical protein
MAGNQNSGRKPKPDGKRTGIHVSNRVLEILKEVGNGENVSLGVELLAYEKKYGQVFCGGQSYTLTDQAELTNRQLSASGTNHYDDHEYFEMAAPAIDRTGNGCMVYWIFWRKYAGKDPETGEPMEAELEAYDYSSPNRVEAR